MLYQGECHCGAIGYTYRTELAPEQWPIRSCQCSFCRMHGELLAQVRMVIEFPKVLKRDKGRLLGVAEHAGSQFRPQPIRRALREKDLERHPAGL
jgi:hypothetical protein